MDNSNIRLYTSCFNNEIAVRYIKDMSFTDSNWDINNIYPDMLVICCTSIDVSKQYNCFFLKEKGKYANYGVKVDELSNVIISSITEEIESLSHYILPYDIFDYVNKDDVTFAVCLSHSYYCAILIPSENMTEDQVCLIAGQIDYDHSFDRDFLAFDESGSLGKWHKKIMLQALGRNIYRSNPNFEKQCELLDKLTAPAVRSFDEAKELMLIASLTLNSMLIEDRLRWLNDSGELHYEDLNTSEFLETVTEAKQRDMWDFLKLSSSESKWHDLIWSIIFVTRGILYSIMYSDNISNNYDEKQNRLYLKGKKDFYGFLPIVTDQCEEILSYYHDHLSPKYNIGFMSIPKRLSRSIWNFFPAYIHEFFHYIAPSNRNERNRVILSLAAHAALNPLSTYLFKNHIDNGENIYKKIFKQIFDILLTFTNIFEPDEMIDNNHFDTMYYLFKMSSIDSLDFGDVFKNIISNYLPYDDGLKDAVAKCTKLFKNDLNSYIRTFTIALREIRSDISMYYLLWHNPENPEKEIALQRYIAILASEPGFAKTDVNITADSVMLRFGFMTRYLWRKTKRDMNGISKKDFTQEWMIEVEALISNLENQLNNGSDCDNITKASKEELKLITQNKLSNLRNFITEYTDIVIFKKDSICRKKDESIFEDLIYPQMTAAPVGSNTVNGEYNGIVSDWEKDLEIMVKQSFLKQLKNIYSKYEDAAIKGDVNKQIGIENNSRLIFRHLLTYCSDIGDLNQY